MSNHPRGMQRGGRGRGMHDHQGLRQQDLYVANLHQLMREREELLEFKPEKIRRDNNADLMYRDLP